MRFVFEMEVFTIIVLGILFLVGVFIAYFIGTYRRDRFWKGEIDSHRKDAIAKSRAVLGGHFSENLAPFLPDFPYSPTECRFVGKPVDFIVFKGMDGKEISEVVFVEVKSGNSKLSSQERKLKEAIDNKRISFEEYRVDRDLTSTDKKTREGP